MIGGEELRIARQAAANPHTMWADFHRVFTPEVVVELIKELQDQEVTVRTLTESYIVANEKLISQYKAHEKLKADIDAVIEDWEGSSIPTYGPVNGMGVHDPNGWDMFDVPKDDLVQQLKDARFGVEKPERKPRTRRPLSDDD